MQHSAQAFARAGVIKFVLEVHRSLCYQKAGFLRKSHAPNTEAADWRRWEVSRPDRKTGVPLPGDLICSHRRRSYRSPVALSPRNKSLSELKETSECRTVRSFNASGEIKTIKAHRRYCRHAMCERAEQKDWHIPSGVKSSLFVTCPPVARNWLSKSMILEILFIPFSKPRNRIPGQKLVWDIEQFAHGVIFIL